MAIILLFAAPCSAVSGLVEWKPPRSLPSVSWINDKGQRQSLEALRGKVVILNLWAIWCEPCVREMPDLSDVQTRLGPQGLHVVAIAQEQGEQDAVITRIRQFYKKIGAASLSAYRDEDQSAFSALKARGLPSSYIINKEGKAVAYIEGFTDWQDTKIQALLAFLLAQ